MFYFLWLQEKKYLLWILFFAKCNFFWTLGSQRISDSEVSDFDCDDGVGVVSSGMKAKEFSALFPPHFSQNHLIGIFNQKQILIDCTNFFCTHIQNQPSS